VTSPALAPKDSMTLVMTTPNAALSRRTFFFIRFSPEKIDLHTIDGLLQKLQKAPHFAFRIQ
jgi:hypothetical protein